MARLRLTEQEDRAWRGFHRMRTHLVAHLARELARDSGLTEAEHAILLAVAEAPNRRLRARDLSRFLEWERSRLSHQIARMEARGTVRREACPDDARGFDVLLTDTGLAAIRAAAPGHLSVVRHCFVDVLTPEQLDTLGDIAEAITHHLAIEHGEAASEVQGSSGSKSPLPETAQSPDAEGGLDRPGEAARDRR